MKKIILGLGFVCLFTLSSCSSNNTDKTKNVKSSSTSTSYKTKKSTTSISTQEAVSSQKIVPDYKPNGQYMSYSEYQSALKAAGFTNITLDPQAKTNQQADGYVYSVSPSKEIVATYSVYTAPAPTSSSTPSSN